LQLLFTKIDSNDYFSHHREYSSQIIIDSTIVNKAGSTFILPVQDTERKFSCGINYENCTYYKGFITPLNMYILIFCGNAYCNTFLLDKSTGQVNDLQSPFDTECDLPALSIDQEKLIAFSSSAFDKESFISLYKKNNDTGKIEFKEFDSFYTSDWRIKEIIWIDTNSFALKIYDKYGGKSGGKLINVKYLKATIQ